MALLLSRKWNFLVARGQGPGRWASSKHTTGTFHLPDADLGNLNIICSRDTSRHPLEPLKVLRAVWAHGLALQPDVIDQKPSDVAAEVVLPVTLPVTNIEVSTPPSFL